MFIGRTAAYYDCEEEYLFTPKMWDVEDDANNLAGDIHELTQEGEDFVWEYFDDVSVGYDLRDGKCSGLAAVYTREEIFERIVNDNKLVK